MLRVDSVVRTGVLQDVSLFTIQGRADGEPFSVQVSRPVREDAARLFIVAESCENVRDIRALARRNEI